MEQQHRRDIEQGPDSGPLGDEGMLGGIVIIESYSEYGPEGLPDEGSPFGPLSTLALLSSILRGRRSTEGDPQTETGPFEDGFEGAAEYGESPALVSATLYLDGIPVGGLIMVHVPDMEGPAGDEEAGQAAASEES